MSRDSIMEERKKRWRPSLTAYRALEDEVSSLKEEKMLLEKSNGYMEKDLSRLRAGYESMEREVGDLEREVCYLRNRSFWDRVFNK